MKRVPILLLVIATHAAWADTPTVISAEAKRAGMGWRVSATISHPSETWEHYADAWQIVDDAGTPLATRELMHPHPTEQPFTRSINHVMLPDGTRVLHVRARCSKEGWSKPQFTIRLME